MYSTTTLYAILALYFHESTHSQEIFVEIPHSARVVLHFSRHHAWLYCLISATPTENVFPGLLTYVLLKGVPHQILHHAWLYCLISATPTENVFPSLLTYVRPLKGSASPDFLGRLLSCMDRSRPI
jgi:hypothetical protein